MKMNFPFKSELKEAILFVCMVFLHYNIRLYKFIFDGSFHGMRKTGNISYKFISQVLFLFLTLFLTYLLWSDFGISFYSLSRFYFIALVFLYIPNMILNDLGFSDEKYPGIANVRSISLLLFSAIGSVGCAYYAGYLMDLPYFYKLFKYIMNFIFFYYHTFFSFSLIRACVIDDSKYWYDKISNWYFETKVHSLYLQLLSLCFLFVLVCNFYSNIKDFGVRLSDWVLDYTNLRAMFISFLIPSGILVLSLCIIMSVRYLAKPEHELLQTGIYNFFWILGGFIILGGNLNWISFFIIMLSYIFLCYIIKKIISDYLRTYKYLGGVLYLILLLVFLSMFF